MDGNAFLEESVVELRQSIASASNILFVVAAGNQGLDLTDNDYLYNLVIDTNKVSYKGGKKKEDRYTIHS